MLLARICAILAALSILLGQRVRADAGGGDLNPFLVAFLALALLMWIRDGDRAKSKPRPYRALAINTVGPLLALMAVLPIAGVCIGRYEPGALYALTVPAFVVGLLSLARAQRLHGLRVAQLGFAVILINGLYGLGQTLFRLNVLPEGAWEWASKWDADSQFAVSEAYVVTTRSTGLFINANLFGLWSTMAVLFSTVMLRGPRRVVGIAIGVAGIVGSQSRTAWVALVLLVVVAVVRALRDTAVAGRTFGAGLVLAPAAMIGFALGWWPSLVEDQLVERLESGLAVIQGGIRADENLSSRADVWTQAWAFSPDYPFGTWGPPELLFGSFIDNEFLSLFLQGSLPLVLAFLFALHSPVVLGRRGVPHAGALGLASGLVIVFSVTMLPLEAVTATALLWLLAASAIGSTNDDLPALDEVEMEPSVSARV